MIWDPLIHWIGHVGSGSWASFKRAVAALVKPGDDAAAAARTLRVRFSDLGLAEFFIGGTERWRAFAPCVASAPHAPTEALLAGAHTDRIILALGAAAAKLECRLMPVAVDGFTVFRLYGDQIAAVAVAAGLPYEANIGQRLASRLVTLDETIQTAQEQAPIFTWTPRSFDFTKNRWRDGLQQHTAVEFTSRYLERRYYVHIAGSCWLMLPKREALYVAAANRRCRLAAYDARSRELWTPAEAPLPEQYARAACMAAGRASVLRDGRIVYERVPPTLAAVLLAGLKQSAPAFHVCSHGTRKEERR